MAFAEIFAKRDEYCVWLDWKAGIEEALYALREDFGRRHSFLDDVKLDEVADNYAAEEPEEQMLALGQQCTVYGAALYNVDRGSDEYGLYLVLKDDMESFEACAQESGTTVTQLKQPRKKFGSIAKKIKHEDKLPYAKFKLPENSHIEFAGEFAANQIRHYTVQGAFSHKTSVSYNLATWPPRKQTNKDVINYVAYSPEYEMWAAVFGEDSLNAKLKVSPTPFEKRSWREIPFPETPNLAKWEADPAYKYYHGDVLDVLTRPMWVGADLVLAYIRRHKPGSFASVTHVWLVENAANGGSQCRKIMVTPPCALAHGEFPHLAQTLNNTYVLLSGRFYALENGELKDTGIEALTHTEFDAVPTGPHTFAYVAEGRLVEVDMYRSCSRFREMRYMDYKAFMRKLNDDWAVILRYGYTNSALDLAQFWRIKTDEWLRLKYGAFGKEGIKNIVQLNDGGILVQTGSELCKLEDLWGFLAAKEDTILEMPVWDTDWSLRSQEDADEGAEGDNTGTKTKRGFWGGLKALLGFK